MQGLKTSYKKCTPGSFCFIGKFFFFRVDPTVQFDSSHRKFSALELAAMDDCCDFTDKLALLAEFTEIPVEIKEVMEMGTDGDDEKEARLRKLASLLKIDMD